MNNNVIMSFTTVYDYIMVDKHHFVLSDAQKVVCLNSC